MYARYQREIEQPKSDTAQCSIVDFASQVSSPSGEASGRTYCSSSSRAKFLTESLVRNVIIGCGLPVSVVSYPQFRQFCKDMDSKYEPPCRQTVSNVLIPRIVEKEKERLKDKLERCSSICLTSDIWTDRRCHSYLGVTAHTLTGGVPSSDLLAFKTVQGSHTGQRINDELEHVIAEFDMKSKIRHIVTDNASNMIKAMSLFFPSDEDIDLQSHVDDIDLWNDLHDDDAEAVFVDVGSRISCFCHSLQLVIRSGLEKATGSRSAMAKVTKLSNLLHQSCVFRADFEAKFIGKHLVPVSNDTRWNSVYRQLAAVVSLDNVKLSELLRETSHENLVLSNKEQSQLQELVQVLEPFAQATDVTHSDSMITISLVVPTVLVLSKKLLEMRPVMRTQVAVIDELYKQMHERFHDLYEQLNIEHLSPRTSKTLAFNSNVFLMAAALDPLYGFRWLVDHPGSAEAKDALRRTTMSKNDYFHVQQLSCY